MIIKETKNNINEVVLIADDPETYSQYDYEAFWEWTKKIPSITKIGYRNRKLYMHINLDWLDAEDLENLIGLFYRYNMPNMEQFQQFLNDDNKQWFYEDKSEYFHERIWGTPFKKPKIKKGNEITLQCKLPKFRHQHEKEVFFRWLEKIECVKKITQTDDVLYLHLPQLEMVYDEDLGSLMALFYRYNVPNMEQFQKFLRDDRDWICQFKEAYWYNRVWPKNNNHK